MIYGDVREQVIQAFLQATNADREVRESNFSLWDDGDTTSEANYDHFTGTATIRFEARRSRFDAVMGREANAFYARLRQMLFTNQEVRKLVQNLEITEMIITPPETDSNIFGVSVSVSFRYRHAFTDPLTID